MKINKPYGSKERLFELMKNVSKAGRLKEAFDYHDAEMNHLGQQDLNAHHAETQQQQNDPQKKFELDLATKMFNNMSRESYIPLRNPHKGEMLLDRIALQRMMKDGLVDWDSEEGEDYFWFTDRGRAEITSPQMLKDDYFYMDGGSNDSESPYLRGREPES